VTKMNDLLNNYDIIIAPASKNALGVLKNLPDWQWSFMGTDPCLRETIVTNFGDKNRHCYGRELQDISVKQKSVFLNWIALTGEKQKNNVWWATRMAYKNPLKSDFFLNSCFLVLIRKWIQSGVKKRIVITENPWLLRACLENFKDKKVYIIADRNFYAKKLLIRQIASYAKVFMYLFGGFWLWTANKFLSFRYRNDFSELLKKKFDVLICTWVEGRSFNGSNNAFSDPYLGSLNGFMLKKQYDTVVLSLPFLRLNLLKKSYLSKKVIPGIYFANLTDIIGSCTKINPVRGSDHIPLFDGLNIKAIFDFERIYERWLVIHAYLHYRIVKNIFLKKRLDCKFVVYPFENQPWDKMMITGARESKSDCKFIACHNITVPMFFLNFFLGDKEDKIHPQPDTIVANGQYWEKTLKDAGFSCLIVNGGSLRYSPVAQTTQMAKKEVHASRNVLVLLSNSLDYTLDLLFYILRVNEKDKNYLLKPHPDTPEKTIRKYIPEFPKNFRFIGGAMDQWMKEAEWAIHIGTTAAIECMMNGIEVIKYVPERIDLDPLLGTDIQQLEVTDKDKFDFGQKTDFPYPDSNIIAEPFNEEAWNKILVI